jgi:hypothetical protein
VIAAVAIVHRECARSLLQIVAQKTAGDVGWIVLRLIASEVRSLYSNVLLRSPTHRRRASEAGSSGGSGGRSASLRGAAFFASTPRTPRDSDAATAGSASDGGGGGGGGGAAAGAAGAAVLPDEAPILEELSRLEQSGDTAVGSEYDESMLMDVFTDVVDDSDGEDSEVVELQ